MILVHLLEISINGMPNLYFERGRLCDICQKGMQLRGFFKAKNIVSTKTVSLGGNVYALVVMDDCSHYT